MFSLGIHYRGPSFDTQLFGGKGVTVEKLLVELYEKVRLFKDPSLYIVKLLTL